MRIINSITLITLSLTLVATESFAVCNHERKEYESWNQKCADLSLASQISGLAGGGFAILTFGISMAPCVGLAIAAADACGKKGKKQRELGRCEARESAIAAQAEIDKKEREKRADEMNARITASNWSYGVQCGYARMHSTNLFNHFVQAIVDDGFDPDATETKEYILEKEKEYEVELEKTLKALEEKRLREVSNA